MISILKSHLMILYTELPLNGDIIFKLLEFYLEILISAYEAIF